MKQLLKTLHQTILNGQDAVLVTIVASSGSTPRGPGAQMLVTSFGQGVGTIGGGPVEYRSLQIAQEILITHQSRTEHFVLRKEQSADLGMVCGGDTDVWFYYIGGKNPETIAFCEAALALAIAGEPSWLIADITPGGIGSLSVYSLRRGLFGPPVPHEVLRALGRRPKQVAVGTVLFYTKALVPAGRVYLFGGGHISQALVQVLALADFRCVVLDDRVDFCRPELFPGAEECRTVDMENIHLGAQIGPDDMICIMTRGHLCDLAAEAFALTTSAGYIGVIGSRKKTQQTHTQLMERGFTANQLERITTPIGLSIQAETPAEIAISIAAQLILHRARLGSSHCAPLF